MLTKVNSRSRSVEGVPRALSDSRRSEFADIVV